MPEIHCDYLCTPNPNVETDGPFTACWPSLARFRACCSAGGAFILVRHAAKTFEGPAKAKELEYLAEV